MASLGTSLTEGLPTFISSTKKSPSRSNVSTRVSRIRTLISCSARKRSRARQPTSLGATSLLLKIYSPRFNKIKHSRQELINKTNSWIHQKNVKKNPTSPETSSSHPSASTSTRLTTFSSLLLQLRTSAMSSYLSAGSKPSQ